MPKTCFKRPILRSTLVLLTVLLLLPLAAFAQSQAAGGSIEGTVTDESGAVLPGVTVAIKNPANAVSRDATTDARGVFRAPLLPVGSYDITATLDGFTTVHQADVTVAIGQTVTLAITLKVAAAAESITVTAEAPIIEATRGAQASNVGTKAIQNLPVNGRNFIDFVLTTPGVTKDPRLGDISFAGQRGTLNSMVVDGADNNNTFFGQTIGRTGSGRAPYQFSQDAVAEFQVNRNAYSAEYGRAGGAVINVVTKSGTNEFHGSLFDYYRDKSLNENSYANKIAVPERPKGAYHYDQYGGTLGGPIVKDKAFFFVNYDAQRNDTPNDISLGLNLAGLTLPTDPDTIAGLAKLQQLAQPYTRGQNQDVYLLKADWQITDDHRLSARYNKQKFTGKNFENGGATNAEQHTGDSLVETDTFNASLASVFSSTFFNEARLQWGKDNEPGEANSDVPEATVRQGGRTILVVGRNFFSPRYTNIERYQIADTATAIVGDHTLKGGADYLHDDIKNFFPGNFSGSYTFNSIASYNKGIPNGSGETYVQAFPGAGTTGALTEPNSHELALFAQDEWHPRPDLTVNIGLRYDLQEFAQPPVRNPDPQLAAAGIDTSKLKTDRNNVAPRLGIAWTPNDKLVVRAGYGKFFGRTPAIMVGTAHSNNGVNVQTVTFTGAQVPTYPNIFPTLPTGAALPKPTIFVFDPNYEQPEIQQASLGGEYAVSNDFALGASYLHVTGRKLQRSTDINIGTPVATDLPILGGGSLTVQQFPTARPFTNFARIIEFQSSAKSDYDGMTLELRKRYSHSWQGSLAYTLGKVTDTAPDATAVVPGGSDDAKFASNPADFNADKAPGVADQRHRVVFSGLYNLPDFADQGGWKQGLLGGWSLSWIVTAASGQPYSETVTNDMNRDGNTRNDIVPGSRNSHNLPWSETIDLRVSKLITIHDQFKLELIAEAFNLLDRDNINAQRTGKFTYVAATNSLTPQTGFGQSTAAADNRIVQLAARFTF